VAHRPRKHRGRALWRRIYERFGFRSRCRFDWPLVQEMQKHLALELDFRREVESGERIAELFRDDPAVRRARGFITNSPAGA